MELPRRHDVTTTDGLRLAVWESGDREAPPVVLVHGYPDTHAVWDGVAGDLATDHHVITYDVRGAGASDAPVDETGYDLERLVRDLGRVMDATVDDRPVHLVGHDWGSIQSWEAVTTEHLAGRIATFTTISGPSLDHVGTWMARRRARREWRALLRQGLRSWYIAFFQLPLLAPLAWRTIVPRSFPRYLRRVEGVDDPGHPAPTLARDGMNGIGLYRRNVRRRVTSPQARTTDVPVLLVVARQDRFVTPALLDDTADHCETLTRVDVDAGHWLPVADPVRVAELVRSHVAAHR